MTETDLRVTVEKKTDQLNYEDFLGGITRIVTIAGVTKGTKEQQYDIAIVGDSRFWRPPATVLKQLVEAWGDEAKKWVGHRAALYGDPGVMFGGKRLGGIRVSHLSHITEPVISNLSVTRGRRELFTVEPLPDSTPSAPTPQPAATETDVRIAALQTEWPDAAPERQAAIVAEVEALRAGDDGSPDPGSITTPDPSEES